LYEFGCQYNTSEISCLQGLDSEMTNYVSSEMLNRTQSLSAFVYPTKRIVSP